MKQLQAEVERELTERILPFWMRLKDEQNGGLYGMVDYDLHTHKKADKGGIVTARFLWTFSDRKSTRLNSSHVAISYAVFCLKNKTTLSITTSSYIIT